VVAFVLVGEAILPKRRKRENLRWLLERTRKGIRKSEGRLSEGV